MVGVLVGLSKPIEVETITESLGAVHIIVTEQSAELAEQVENLRPDVLLLDEYHADNHPLLTTYRELAPWGYVVLICQHVANFDLVQLADEVWPITALTAGSIRLLQRLARLNRYHSARTSKCMIENIDETDLNQTCFNRLEPFFMVAQHFISPGFWGRQFFQEWNALLQCASQVLGGFTLEPWPCTMPVGNNTAYIPVNSPDEQLLTELQPTLAELGVRLMPFFNDTRLLLLINFEGAFFPVAVIVPAYDQPGLAQLVAEAAPAQLASPYTQNQPSQLLKDIVTHVTNTMRRQYFIALHSFGHCVFCRDAMTYKSYFDAIGSAVDKGIVLLDPECQVVYVNESAVRLLASGSIPDAADNTQFPILNSIMEQAALKSGARSRFTITAPHSRRLSVSVAQAALSEGEPNGYVVTVQDTAKTKGMQIEASLRERLASVGELAAGMAHEIRNPLTSIRGFMQLLRQRLVMGKMAPETRYADYVLEEIDRVNHVVTNFLTLAKPKDEVWLEVDITELLVKMLHLVENQAMLKGVYLTWQFAPNLPSICGKAEALVQVFLNIVTNALQATPKRGSIHIVTRQQGDNVLVSVQDTGSGMTAEVQRRIFNPFYSTKEGGTGLGLALCRQIIDEHRGDIQVTSIFGEGSCFTVCLPIDNSCMEDNDESHI